METLEYHEIVEADHRILNPLTDEKLALLAQICRLEPGQRMLDLACGKAELLATWANRHWIGGVGVDISEVFLTAARARLIELGVADRVELVHANASHYSLAEQFDLASCIGATWIGGGIGGTIAMLRKAIKPGGLILIGEPYWIEEPPEPPTEEFVNLAGTLDRIEAAGMELVEMVLADGDSWDRYEASHWAAADRWLRANPSHPWAEALREQNAQHRRDYLTFARRCLGWGVFVLR